MNDGFPKHQFQSLLELMILFIASNVIMMTVMIKNTPQMFRDNSAMRKHLHTHGPRY